MSFGELAVLCCFCAVLELDNVQAGQFMVSRPSVVGALLGLIAGRLLEGLQIGLWTELLFLDRTPMGESVPTNGLVAAGAGVLVLEYSGLEIPVAFAMGIALGMTYSKVEIWLRNRRSARSRKIAREIIKSLTIECCCCWLFLFFGVILAGIVGKLLWNMSCEQVRLAADLAYGAVPWLGLAALIFKFQPIKQGLGARS
ncbi:MAG: PTS sugar transporter subunit IIC [Deltaproteobacteria bacterium]|nr:PTS sugar transporter subunit IIC [Deltaproteobacteria bacterium]